MIAGLGLSTHIVHLMGWKWVEWGFVETKIVTASIDIAQIGE